MRLQLRRLAVLLAFVPAVAYADGVLNVRHAYYKERSTRVQQPMIDAQFDAGQGRVEAHFLVDSITSASTATGAGGAEFSERRYEGAFGYSHLLPGHLELGGVMRYSTEPDYTSFFFGGHAQIALFDQTTTLRAFAGASTDGITNGVAVMMGSLGTPRREENLSTLQMSLAWNQIVASRLVTSLTYDLIRLSGYQANIYRVVRGGTDPVPERVPDLRMRHAVAASVRFYLPTRTTAILSYRLYADDWGIVAHTPEARLVQEVTPGLDVRLRYRLYSQQAADFYKDVYMQSELVDPTVYVTDDEKLSKLTTHIFGGQVSMALSLVGFRGSIGNVRVDAVVERIVQSTSFGDAWAAQLGLAVPFEY